MKVRVRKKPIHILAYEPLSTVLSSSITALLKQ